MKEKTIFLFFCMIIIAIISFSQKKEHFLSKPANDQITFLKENKIPSDKQYSFVFPMNYTQSAWGFFCKKEWQIEKRTRVPFRFRLGNIDYCNKMEGKINAY